MKIVFAIWFVAVALLSILLYRATRFEYAITETTLEIKLVWAGILRVPKHVPISDVHSVRRVNSLWDIVPLASGRVPSLWGKFRPGRMVLLSMRGSRFFPLIITPDNPDDFIHRISQRLPDEHKEGVRS